MKGFLIKILHSIIKRYCNSNFKKIIWDKEFTNGKWDFLLETKTDPIFIFLEKYSLNGNVLDLGCGAGNTGLELSVDKYETYTGIDISEVAINQAILICKKDYKRIIKNKYIVADILKYIPDNKYNIILFRESLYYFPICKVKKILAKYSYYLEHNGVFIIRIHNRYKYKSLINKIVKNYNVIDNYKQKSSKNIILVFN